MTKLTDKEKKIIVADYLDCQNYSEVAKKHNRSVDTIRKTVLKSGDFINKLKEKKEQTTMDTLDYIMSMKETKTRILSKMLKVIEQKIDGKETKVKQSVKDIATAYGIILDKDMKILEIQRGSANTDQLNKVQELLTKLDQEAKNDIK